MVLAPDGSIDHEKSLKLNGLWSSMPNGSREALLASVISPPEVLIVDMQHELDLLRLFKSTIEAERGEDYVEQLILRIREKIRQDT